MKKRLLLMTASFSLLVVLTAAWLFLLQAGDSGRFSSAAARKETVAAQLVSLNEIEQLAKAGRLEAMSEKTALLREQIRSLAPLEKDLRPVLLCVVCIVCLIFSTLYLYIFVLRPFDRLTRFAGAISDGNFDLPLDFERSNCFGAFTWAFDSMRREVTRARSCEREAAENHKTVIATLSHDIKTPVASIRAYAEGLEANLDGSPEKRARYLGVIMKKCDEVSRLTNDLFLHSLSDLDKLKIQPERIDLCALLAESLPEIAAGQDDLHIAMPPHPVYVLADPARLVQAAENLINNARKYAKTEITISLRLHGQEAELSFRDYGAGIPDEDMPFIFDQFYRGKNRGCESGAGLGLYIVKYIAEQTGGHVRPQNHADGLEMTLVLPAVSAEKRGA